MAALLSALISSLDHAWEHFDNSQDGPGLAAGQGRAAVSVLRTQV